jgi:subtilisin family serine protease
LILSAIFLFENPINPRAQGKMSLSHSRPRYVQGEILVKYKSHVSASTIRSHQDRVGASTIRAHRHIGVRHVKLHPFMSVETALEHYRKNPDVAYAEPNYIRYLRATTPNDPFFSNLWGLHNTGQSVNGTFGTSGADIHGPEAWDVARGSNTFVIAVIDTGVDYNHPDLSGNIWVNPGEVVGNGLDDDHNSHVDDIRGWDFVDDDNDPMDVHGHGTHVSGTIAAVGNNNIGVTGVCWQAKIMPVRALDAFGSGTDANIIAAIGYAVSMGAKVINASFGGPDYAQGLYDAVANANAAGVLFVAAAGNDGTNNDTIPSYPASFNLPNIISVAATNQNDQLSDFSNYGATSVHVAAPGENIYSTLPAARLTVWSDNFDDGDISDWTTGGTNNTWGLSSSTTYNNSHYSLTDSPSGNYQTNTASWARAPVLDLSSYAGTKLEFKVTGKSQETDRLYVQTSTNATSWTDQEIYLRDLDTSVPSLYGDGSDQWYRGEVELGKYDGKSTVYVRFYFASLSSGTSDGWYIDNVSVTAASFSYTGTEYYYKAGTSMAAPHVVGLAGLVWSHYPSSSMSQVRDTIISTVDRKSALTGKVASGGRVNAYNLFLCFGTVETPSSLTATLGSSGGITLTWVDNSGYEIGVKIERKLGTDGTFAQIGTVPTHVTSYTDLEAGPGKAYYYRVRSYNCNVNSNYSNEASITTGATQISRQTGTGGCFIATAAFGSSLAPQVVILRKFRDTFLIKSAVGRNFLHVYYCYSPALSAIIERHETLRAIVRVSLFPLVAYGYWSILIGHGITLAVFLGLFLMLALASFTRMRMGQKQAICKGITS